jgi:hypothetical protein
MKKGLVDLLTIGCHFFENGYMEMSPQPQSVYHMRFQHPLSKLESAMLSKENPRLNMDLYFAIENSIQPTLSLDIPGTMKLEKIGEYRYVLRTELDIEEDNLHGPYTITEKVREIVGDNLQKQRTYWIIGDRTSEMELIGEKENVKVYAKPSMADDRKIVSVVFKIETPDLDTAQSDSFSKMLCCMMRPGAIIAGELPLQQEVFMHQYVDRIETIRSVHLKAIDMILEKYEFSKFDPKQN